MALGVYLTLLTLWTQIGTSLQQSTTCPDGWTKFQNTCYLYVRESYRWNEANTRCAAHGAVLAEPNTWQKHWFLSRIMNDVSAWLGATDSQTEGTWIWNSSGRPITTFLWESGQPNSYRGDQDCLGMFSDGWHDFACTGLTRSYICEKQSTTAIAPVDFLKCPRGWVKVQDICYLHVDRFVTWDVANASCAARNAILAEPDTREKYDSLLQTLGWWSIWLGATDRQTEEAWVWSSSGRPVDPSLWAGLRSSEWMREEEDCLYIFKTDRWSNGWYDAKCSWEERYVCQKQASA